MFRIIFAAAFLCVPSLAYAETCIASHYGVGDDYGSRRIANGEIMNPRGPLLALIFAAAITSPVSAASSSTRDLDVIRDEMSAICTGKWDDEKHQRELCQGQDVLEERMLMAVQKLQTGRSHLDLPPAPTIVPKAGAMNEFLYVAFVTNSMCRGFSTEDEKLHDAICNFRDRLDAVLERRGYCYGMRGQIGADMKWHRCTAHSLRSVN